MVSCPDRKIGETFLAAILHSGFLQFIPSMHKTKWLRPSELLRTGFVACSQIQVRRILPRPRGVDLWAVVEEEAVRPLDSAAGSYVHEAVERDRDLRKLER